MQRTRINSRSRHRTQRTLCWIFVGLSWALLSAAYGDSHAFTFSGIQPRHMVWLGNGRLTLAIEEAGTIFSCFWPSPSHLNQIRLGGQNANHQTAGISFPGLLWGIRCSEKTVWLPLASRIVSHRPPQIDYPVAETEYRLPEGENKCVQRVLVHPFRDVAFVELRADALPDDASFFWFCDFSPKTRRLNDSLVFENVLPRNDDFASLIIEGKYVAQFRPNDLQRQDWEDITNISNMPLESLDKRFKDGVWIVCGSRAPVLAFQCGSETDEQSSAWLQVSSGKLSNSPFAAGFTNWAVQLLPEESSDTKRATAVFALGNSLRESLGSVKMALEAGFDEGVIAARDFWNDLFSNATFSARDDLAAIQKQSLLAIRMATDKYSNGIVRAPVLEGYAFLERLDETPWVALACDLLGKPDWAEAYLRHIGDSLFRGDRPERRAGCLPVLQYTDGVAAAPLFLPNTDAVGMFLWGVWNHASFLSNEKREAFLRSFWPHVEQAADYLVDQVHVTSGVPLPSFRPELLRVAEDVRSLISGCAGLSSAASIAESLNLECERWLEAKQVFLNRLESLLYTTDTETILAPLWPLVASGCRSESVKRAVQRRFADLGRLEQVADRWMVIADVALLAERDPNVLDHIRPLVSRKLGITGFPRTTTEAAHVIIATAAAF